MPQTVIVEQQPQTPPVPVKDPSVVQRLESAGSKVGTVADIAETVFKHREDLKKVGKRVIRAVTLPTIAAKEVTKVATTAAKVATVAAKGLAMLSVVGKVLLGVLAIAACIL